MSSFEIVNKEYRKFPDKKIDLPLKGSQHSAGYDLYSNETVDLEPHTSHVFWTDIKACLNVGYVLMLFPRSSMGIKHSIMIGNTVGIIDGDYYENETNDGNIAVCLYNYGDKSFIINEGDRIAQAVIVRHGVASKGYKIKDVVRKGGIGSTGK